jgi:peptidoglycan/xylan/chitin deacetylase (PgdA/CDA1 family)
MDSIRIKRGAKAQLPSELPLGELAFCTDTRELYVGMGEGTKPRPVTNTEITGRLAEVSSQLDTNVQQLNNKINEVATAGTTVEVLQATTETYIQEKINDGTIANLTIEEGSVTPEKTSFIDTINIFDYTKAEVVNLSMQSSTGKVYSSTSKPVQSIIVKVKPNSDYNFSGVGIGFQHIYTTENIPQVGEPVIRDIHYNSNVTEDGRYYTDIQTSSNENYLLICLIRDNTTDTLEIRKSIQLSEGLGLKQFSKYGVGTLSSNIKISSSSIQQDEIKKINELNVNVLANKQLGQLEKGYICISFDDGFATAQSNTFPIIREKNIPVTFCCWTDSEIITNESYLTELKELISTYNCSVAQHGVGDFTTYGDNELYNYLKSEKEKWNSIGINVNGLTYPNHKRNNHTRAICGNLFGVCQSGGADYPIIYGTYNQSGARSNIFDLYRNSGTNRTLAQLKSGIDEAYEKHMIYSVMWHDTHLTTSEQQKLKDMIDYAKAKGITFITIGDIEKAI